MIRWCEAHRKQATRRRFLGWINRIELPMAGSKRGTSDEIARKLGYEEGM